MFHYLLESYRNVIGVGVGAVRKRRSRVAEAEVGSKTGVEELEVRRLPVVNSLVSFDALSSASEIESSTEPNEFVSENSAVRSLSVDFGTFTDFDLNQVEVGPSDTCLSDIADDGVELNHVDWAASDSQSEPQLSDVNDRLRRRDVLQVVPRILNGTVLVDSAYASVGIVGNRRSPAGFGTGTLIDSQWILTAGHVSRGVGAKAGRFIIDGATYETEKIFKFPKFRYGKLGTDDANDIALWKLRQPVSGITPSSIDRQDPQVGDQLVLVGFGSGGNSQGEVGDFGTKRQGTTEVDDVSRTLISWDFDHRNESNTGHGDSGGPAFIVRNGVPYIAGVTSGGEKGDASFGDHSYDTRVEAYADWIDETLAMGTSGSSVQRLRRSLAGMKLEETTSHVAVPAEGDLLTTAVTFVPNQTTSLDASTRSSTSLDFENGARSGRTGRTIIPRIINGDPISESEFPSVGKINSPLGVGTGTLISSRWVLTAAHASVGVENTSGTFEVNGEVYHTERVIVHPKFNSSRFGTNGANDLALWKLDRPVVGITPSEILQKSPKVGVQLTLVGYGLGGDENGATGSYGTKRVGQTRLDEKSSKVLRWNFDSPTESNTAGGDSGGPAFVQVNGVYLLAGVTSGGRRPDSGLGDVSVDTRAGAYLKWIRSTMGSSN